MGVPSLDTEWVVKNSDGVYVVSLRNCLNDHELTMAEIEVFRGDEREGRVVWGDPICNVVHRPSRNDPEAVSEWEYGEAPPGYAKEGACPPMVPGATYLVSVLPPTVGRLEIERRGRAKVKGYRCPRPEEKLRLQ